jgi:hypothetical protein
LHEISQQGWEPVLALEDQGLIQAFHSTLSYAFLSSLEESNSAVANTRGADKILYAGYFPMGLSLERIMNDMPKVPFRDHVWPIFCERTRCVC